MEAADGLRYIAVEGVIGAGKTALAERLSAHFDANLVLEQFEENPFLERFYANPERWAFQTQLTFLAARYRQHKQLAERDLFQSLTISDYAFEKDRIFAHQNLSGDELQLYETLYSLMETTVPSPDLIVYLRSTVNRLMRNIQERGRPYEADMKRSYIEGLHEAYERYFESYAGGKARAAGNARVAAKLLIVDASEIDFVANDEELQNLIDRILQFGVGS